MKLSGLRISWATPAVSSPSAASFSLTTIWSWASRRSSSTSSSSLFFPCSSWASCSTRLRRCTSRACWRNTSNAAAMSATSSRPPTSIRVSRSPPAMRRIHTESSSMRRSRPRPMYSHAIRTAPATLTTVIPISRFRPVSTACADATVAACESARAFPTKASTSATRSTACSRFMASSSTSCSTSLSSRSSRSKPLFSPTQPRQSSR